MTAIRQQYNENAKSISAPGVAALWARESQAAKAKLQRALEKEAAKKALM